MALRFRRSLKIAPGIRLNLGSKSASVRVGGRAAGISAGTSGTRISGGIPGTGLSVTKKLAAKSAKAEARELNRKGFGVLSWIGAVIVLICIAAVLATVGF